MRGIVTSLQVIAPRSVEMRIHAKSAELLSWFPREHEQRTSASIPWSELTRPIEQAEAWQRASSLAHTG